MATELRAGRSGIESKAKKMASFLENLETRLEMFIENVRQIRIIVGDFQPQGQNVLNQKNQSLVHGLQETDRLKAHVQEVPVPLDVFGHIDQGPKSSAVHKRLHSEGTD